MGRFSRERYHQCMPESPIHGSIIHFSSAEISLPLLFPSPASSIPSPHLCCLPTVVVGKCSPQAGFTANSLTDLYQDWRRGQSSSSTRLQGRISVHASGEPTSPLLPVVSSINFPTISTSALLRQTFTLNFLQIVPPLPHPSPPLPSLLPKAGERGAMNGNW